ncbi:MAG: hypothetical protein M5U09_28120 [Gammaproteobacteria bacterium]|nr:hypothetical protein [Gammaproteobacteria bacterium]
MARGAEALHHVHHAHFRYPPGCGPRRGSVVPRRADDGLRPGAAPKSAVPSRIAIRTVEGVAEFYDTVTGDTFVPRGTTW